MADMNAGFSRELIIFLEKYTELLERQVTAVRETMACTVSDVMTGISTISKTTTLTREKAAGVVSEAGSSQNNAALSHLDDELRTLLTQMMGALSNDDVIGQRLEHVVQSIQALKIGLTYLLVDFGGRFNSNGVKQFKIDLMDTTFRQYTSEEERDLFTEIMGKLSQTLKKAS